MVVGDVAEPVSQDPNKVFDTVAAPVVDIGTIVSRRLNAMRMLQKDPNDAQALAEMYDAQQMMSDWASSKNKPGQFVGSTGEYFIMKGKNTPISIITPHIKWILEFSCFYAL